MENDLILITGASGFLGRRLTKHLLAARPAARLRLADVRTPPIMQEAPRRVEFVEADLGDAAAVEALITPQVGTVFHLAALVSGGAEEHFEAGFRVNMLGMIHMLEACRHAGRCPRFIFPGTIASFGGEGMPRTVDDWTFQHPQSSYGAAKVAGEQLLNDYSRRGFVDGRGVRLPAVMVRDDPHAGLSCTSSALVREPVAGKDYASPLPSEARFPVLGIARCLDLFVGLAELPPDSLGDYRTVNGPNVSVSMGEIADAVHNCGSEGLGRITFDSDTEATAVVATWPKAMKFERAASLSFQADDSLQAIVEDYVRAHR